MIFDEPRKRVWLCTKPTDMRKSFNGLQAIILNDLHQQPLDGDFFVFLNKRKSHMKILYFDRTGFCIWMKRLELGQFRAPTGQQLAKELTWTELKLVLEGIEIEKARYSKRWNYSKVS